MYVEICTTPHSRKDPRRAFKRFPSVIRTGKNMYRIQAEDRKLRKIRRICRRRKYELKRSYPENWGRSSSYRRDFFAAYPRPLGGYRCRYCHRHISDQKLTVDHIYPVYMTRKAGIWIVKAIVGKHEIYWMIRRLLQLALLALIAYLAVSCHLPELIRSLILALHL